MAQALEAEPDVEMILGLGANEPRVPLERTEFVRSDQKYSILSRIVRATQVDTIVHTFLETNSVNVSSRALHEINVIGTLNLLAAAGSPAPRCARWWSSPRPTSTERRRPTRPGSARTTRRTEPGPHPAWSDRSSRSSPWSATSPRTTPTWWCRSSGSPTCWAPTSSPRSATTSAGGSCPASPGSTRWSSSSRRTTWSGRSSTSPATGSPGVFNVAGAGKLPWSEVASICGAYLLPAAARPAPGLRRPRCAGWGSCSSPRDGGRSSATDGAWTPPA